MTGFVRKKWVVEKMNKLKTYLELIRYPLFAIPIVATLPGIILASDLLTWQAPVAMLTALIGYWAGMMKNDYFHRETDAVANPDRPLPSERISSKSVFILASGMYVVCLAMGFAMHYKAGIMVIVLIMISHAYNAILKSRGIWGSISLPIGIGLLTIFGAFAVSGQVPTLVWFAFAAITFYDFGTHIITTFKDIERDRKIGIRTTPIQIGIKPALAISSIATLSSFAVALFPYLIGLASWKYLIWLAIALIATLVTRLPLLIDQKEKNGYLALKGSMVGAITFFPCLISSIVPFWQSTLIILPLLGLTFALLETAKQEV